MLTRTQWIEQFKADLRDYRNAVCDFMMWGNSEEAVAATHSKVVCRVLTLANRVKDWPTTTDAQTNRLLSAIESAPANPIKALSAGVVDGDPIADESGFSAGAGNAVATLGDEDFEWVCLRFGNIWRDGKFYSPSGNYIEPSTYTVDELNEMVRCNAALRRPRTDRPAVDPTTDPERFCEFTGPCDGEAR
jgi:hypothetical protein